MNVPISVRDDPARDPAELQKNPALFFTNHLPHDPNSKEPCSLSRVESSPRAVRDDEIMSSLFDWLLLLSYIDM